MSTIVVDSLSVRIPVWVVDLESFRRWADSEEFPDSGRICYLNGEVWVDMSKEQLAHNQVKGTTGSVLMNLAGEGDAGMYFPDGYYLSNDIVGLSTNPDGMFASAESLRIGRVRLVKGVKEGYVELQGSPDMALEVISQSSLHKDTDGLRELYWQAGIREYWLIDVRGELEFNILRHTAKGYVATRKQGGWVKSSVFGKSFRLTEQANSFGYPRYTLEVR